MLAGYWSMYYAVNQNNFIAAVWLIGLAALLDALDGKVARITNSSSKFGVEYDSLADVVSFGVAPSVLIYQYYFDKLEMIGLLLSFAPLLFGSIRLARFNVQLSGFTKTHFSGLPIPAAAITIISYILFMETYLPGERYPHIFIPLTLIVSLLMVTNVRYSVLAVSLKGNKWAKLIVAILIIVGIIIILFPELLAFPVMLGYILWGLFNTILYKTTHYRESRLENKTRSHNKKPYRKKQSEGQQAKQGSTKNKNSENK